MDLQPFRVIKVCLETHRVVSTRCGNPKDVGAGAINAVPPRCHVGGHGVQRLRHADELWPTSTATRPFWQTSKQKKGGRWTWIGWFGDGPSVRTFKMYQYQDLVTWCKAVTSQSLVWHFMVQRAWNMHETCTKNTSVYLVEPNVLPDFQGFRDWHRRWIRFVLKLQVWNRRFAYRKDENTTACEGIRFCDFKLVTVLFRKRDVVNWCKL